MRTILLFLFFFSSAFSLEIESNFIKDEFGKKVPLKEYKRIVVYNLGAVEILYRLGAGDRVVAIPKSKKDIYPKEKTKKISNLSSISKPSLEEILKYNPDLVIFNIMGELSEELKKFNIPSLTFRSKNLEEIIKNIKILSLLTNTQKEGEKLSNDLKLKLNRMLVITPNSKTAIILHSLSPLSSFSKYSLPVEILEKLGVKVFTPSMKKQAIISSEYILKNNPDFIIGTRGIKQKDELINGIPLIKESKAYKNNQIFIIDSEIIMRGSHRVFDEIDKISTLLNL